MQHQILSLRPKYNEKRQRWEKTDNEHFGKWNAPSLRELFADIEKYFAQLQIPESERWNLYYTVALCTEKKREFNKQNAVVFDIDGIDLKKIPEYIEVITSCLGIKKEETVIVGSGNGLHFIIGLRNPIEEATFFDKNRRHYQAICAKLKLALTHANLVGKPDTAVFDPARIMRLPGTENRKDGQETKLSHLIYNNLVDINFSLAAASGLPEVEAAGQINKEAMKKYPIPDTDAILQGCEFLKSCKTDPNKITEQQWYASLSILPRLPPNGRDLAHEYSRGHKKYSSEETECKIDQALEASGPRTCSNINQLWGKCASCKFHEKVKSPIMIQGEGYIKTASTGFHDTYVTPEGVVKTGKPNYEDLRRFFEKEAPYVILAGSGICFRFNGKHWEHIEDLYLQNYAQSHFNPVADTRMCTEFKNIVCRTNIKSAAWFIDPIAKKINFKNGVLDTQTMVLSEHSIEYGFRYVLPYDYNPEAKAPFFKKFMNDITVGRPDLTATLEEFVGYAISNDRCWAEKALIMTGIGANGKSTFMKILQKLVGKDNYSSLTLKDLGVETARKLLDGKLFNLSEETPTNAMSESSVFKNLVSGGEMTVKMLYKQQYSITNKAKLIFACNNLPPTKDTSRGYLRKLLILPFDAHFEGDAVDHDIDEKLAMELSGIFNIVISAYKELRKRGRFPKSATIDNEASQYRNDIDTVKVWVDECLDIGDFKPEVEKAPFSPLAKLYASYNAYAENMGTKPENRATMSRRLRYLLPEYDKRWTRHQVSGRREIIYKGVVLNDGSNY